MKYKKFIIKNFKGIKYLELDLDKKPTPNVFSLVGLNESGKTTILEALSWYYQPDDFEPHEIIPKSDKANFNDSISVDAEISLSVDDENQIARYMKVINKFIISKPIENIIISRSYKYENSILVDTENIWDLEIMGKTRRMKENKILQGDNEHWKSAMKLIKSRIISPIIYYRNFLFDFIDTWKK